MALADELAYITAMELAGRIRRRELSPVEVVDVSRAGGDCRLCPDDLG
jgi:amidase/aspartyl-tRNA(Asn)/glutamyl-tRNA(Gln) amidotransferase subunit A